jgi:hypothetical protein
MSSAQPLRRQRGGDPSRGARTTRWVWSRPSSMHV